MISDARSKKLFEYSHNLDVRASHNWSGNVIKDLSKLSLYHITKSGFSHQEVWKGMCSQLLPKTTSARTQPLEEFYEKRSFLEISQNS